MAAPAAPSIHVMQDGTCVYVRWEPVPDATDYNVYLGETLHPEGVEDSVADDEIEDDGWFLWVSMPYCGPVYVRLTALNAEAEESDYSNERTLNLRGPSPDDHSPHPR